MKNTKSEEIIRIERANKILFLSHCNLDCNKIIPIYEVETYDSGLQSFLGEIEKQVSNVFLQLH